MSIVHKILYKLSFECNHSTPLNAYGSVKAYSNFAADWDDFNIEMTMKNKDGDEVTIDNILTHCGNEEDIALSYQRRTKKEFASALKSILCNHLEMVIWGLLKTPAQYDASDLKASRKSRGLTH